MPQEADTPVVTPSLPRILFVDDEAPLVKMGSMMLRSGGYELSTAPDGAAALAAFQAEPDAFAAVITDHTMPHLTGLQLLAEVRRLRPEQPVVLCSGQPEMEQELAASGMDGRVRFVPKPYTTETLQRAVRDLLAAPD